MTIKYNARLYSSNPLIDNLPVALRVMAPVKSKFRWVEPLCNNATQKEIKWYNEQIVPNIVKKDDK